MTDPTKTIQSLLRRAGANSGATPEEAHLSARRALEIAEKYELGGLTLAKCRNTLHKAECRRRRAA